MAVNAEQLRSGPGATAWILACERACCVTSRALDVFRDKVLVSCVCEGSEDVSGCRKQDAQSHTHRAHPHAHSVEAKTLTVSGVRQHACGHLFVGMGAVKDQQANATLTVLNLGGNNVGDAGAAALAESLKAMACACCYQMCHFTLRCEQMTSSGCFEVCMCGFCVVLVS